MPDPPSSLLYDCAWALIDTAVGALDDPPDRRFAMVGDPLQYYADCPFIACALSPNGLGSAIATAARGRSIPPRPTAKTSTSLATFTLWVVPDVCFPVYGDNGSGQPPEPPDASVIDAASQAILTAQLQVWDALKAAVRDASLFAGLLAGDDPAELDPPSTFVQTGGTAGFQLQVRCDLIGVSSGS